MTAAAAPRPSHKRAAPAGAQRAYVVFGGGADMAWMRPLRRGFRHCFAALEDAGGWTVLDPLSGRLVVARLDLPPGFDLPGFYRRAGLTVLGPFPPGGPRRRLLPPLAPFSCVSLCRAVLGAGAPFALTPFGLFRALVRCNDTGEDSNGLRDADTVDRRPPLPLDGMNLAKNAVDVFPQNPHLAETPLRRDPGLT